MKTIKNYKLFKESLLDYLKGPTEEEFWDAVKNTSLSSIFFKSLSFDYFKGIMYALNNGFDIKKNTHIMGRPSLNKLLKMLYENGEKNIVFQYIDSIGSYDSYRFVYSCLYGYLKGVKEWLKHSENKESYNLDGLELAIKHNQQKIFEYIIETFESTDKAYKYESKAKEFARRYNNREVLDYFLYRGY